MFVPLWILALTALVVAATTGWAILVAKRRNPLPFPDPGSRIFTAASAEAKAAIVELLERHGIRERFQVDTSGIRRSIMWDGTIINLPPPESRAKLGNAAASIGLVAADPDAAAREAAEFLRSRGFSAELVPDVEPDLPIAFVVTDAFAGTVLNFRKHMIHLPRPR
jgi:hypothetical protein